MADVYLNCISTAVPPHDVHDRFLGFARQSLAQREAAIFDRLARKSQIDHRYSFIEPHVSSESMDKDGFYRFGSFPSTSQRMRFFEDNAMTLADRALTPLFEKVRPSEITHLIVTNCTGLMAPGLDLLIQKRWNLRHDLERSNVFFMGCYAAFNGLKLARHIVRSEETAKVLVMSLEMCTIHLQETVNLEDMMGFLQFADGCAAAVLSRDAFGLRVDEFQSSLVPEGKDLITWKVGDRGFDMFLSLDVPQVLGEKIPELWSRIWKDEDRPELVAVHPGGRAILDSVQARLSFSDEQMLPSRKVLRQYGNMSSATILFVLAELLKQNNANGKGVAMAFGPGLTVESLKFKKELT